MFLITLSFKGFRHDQIKTYETYRKPSITVGGCLCPLVSKCLKEKRISSSVLFNTIMCHPQII